MKTLTKFLLEAPTDSMVDISIPNILKGCSVSVDKDKITPKMVKETKTLLEQTHFIIEEKMDGCLDYFTCIETNEGPKFIGDVVDNQKNYKVLSYNFETQQEEFKPITAYRVLGPSNGWVRLKLVEGSQVVITLNHWVWCEEEQEYKQIKDFKIYDTARLKGYKTQQIIAIDKIKNSSNRYDIEVEDNKNYFANSILVHNTKLNIIRNETPFDENEYEKNWYICFKNFILNSFEFNALPSDGDIIKNESHGISQYKLVHDKLKKAHNKLKNIPPKTEFFIEFLMDKPTLTQTYSAASKHSMILLGHSAISSLTTSGGKLFTTPGAFIHDYTNPTNELFMNALKISKVKVVFEGKLFDSAGNFNEAGCKYTKLQTLITSDLKEKLEKAFKDLSPTGPLMEIKVGKTIKKVPAVMGYLHSLFTKYPSSFGGGKIEGSVLIANSITSSDRYKFVQEDQYDVDLRSQKKSGMFDTEEDKTRYFKEISNKAHELFRDLQKQLPDKFVDDYLKEASTWVYLEDLSEIGTEGTRKTTINKQDDLYVTLKGIILDTIDYKENDSEPLLKGVYGKENLGLFIGKMRLPTNAHYDILKKAEDLCSGIIVVLVVTPSQKGLSFQERKQIILSKFPEAKVIQVSSANLSRILSTYKEQVSFLFCGEDREEYEKQLVDFNTKYGTSISLNVTSRTSDEVDISSTKVEEAIHQEDLKTVQKLTNKFDYFNEELLRTLKAKI